jgi:sugar lactone lactonase YvrE
VITARIGGVAPNPADLLPEIEARQLAIIGEAGDAEGELTAPRSVAVDDEGQVYVADPERGKIVRYAHDGTFLNEWGHPEQLGYPSSVVVAPDQTIVALDPEAGRITRYDQDGAFLGVVATLEGRARGMSLGLDGQLYVAITSDNQLVVLPGSGPSLATGETLPAEEPAFNQPTSAIADADGSFFVYEPASARLHGYDADGQVRFTQPAPSNDTIGAGALALLPDGRLLLADPIEQRIIVYSTDGDPLGSFGVEGTPQGLSVTPSGMVAVTDTAGQCVRLYDLGE